MKVCLAYLTFKNKEEAKKIAKILLEKHTISCFNLFPEGLSLYSWQGEVQENSEVFAFAKLKESHFEKLCEEVTKHHSYEVPCILKLPIENGYPPFLEWIKR